MTDQPDGQQVRVPVDRATVRAMLGRVKLEVRFRARGHKSSEGDGRTAADIRRELGLRPKEG